jgi:hypothetical protein
MINDPRAPPIYPEYEMALFSRRRRRITKSYLEGNTINSAISPTIDRLYCLASFGQLGASQPLQDFVSFYEIAPIVYRV